MRTENERFLFWPQNQTHRIWSTTLSCPSFSDCFDSKLSQILVLNSGRMVAPCGTRKRFREIFASSLDYMGLVAPEHLSPCRSSMVLATRETRHIHTLHARRVVFSSRWLCRSRLLTISQTATTLLVLDEAKNVVAQHRSCSRSRDNHNNHVPTARGDA